MANRFVVFVVFAAVVQGSFPSTLVEGSETPLDLKVAHKKAHEEFIQAVDIVFGSIGGNTTFGDTKNGYLEHLMTGCYYYAKALPSYYSADSALQHQFESSLESFVITVCKAIELAQSNKGTYSEIVNQINEIRRTISVEPIVSNFFKMAGTSIIVLETKLIVDLDIIYENVFGAMISRTALNSGMIDEIPSYFKAAVISGVEAISDSLYDALKEHV